MDRDSYFRNNYCFRVVLEQLLVYSRGKLLSNVRHHSTEHPENSFQAQSQHWTLRSISLKVKLLFFSIEKLWAILQVFCFYFGFCKNWGKRSGQLAWCPSEVVRSRYRETKPEADEHDISCGTCLKLRDLLLSWRLFCICMFTSSWRSCPLDFCLNTFEYIDTFGITPRGGESHICGITSVDVHCFIGGGDWTKMPSFLLKPLR